MEPRRPRLPAEALPAGSPARRRLKGRGPAPLALEQRFMFDGAAVATVADAAHIAPDAAAKALIPDVPAPVEVRPADPGLTHGGKREVAFVDTSVANYRTLEAGIHAGVEIVEIDGGRSGLAQIAKWAESHTGYDAVHILGHGGEGALYLGSDTLTADKLNSPVVQAELAELGHALAVGGDLLLYGCDIARGDAGQALVAALASATGADVAASTDRTGNAAQGGDWTLEAASGAIDVSALAVTDYAGTLAATTFSADSGSTATDASVNGAGSQYAINITDNASGNTLHIASTGTPMFLDTAINLGDSPTGMSGRYIKTDWNVDWTTSITITVIGGKLFDFRALDLQEAIGTATTFTFTTSGGAGQDSTFTANQYKLIDFSGDSRFQGITSLTITASSGMFQLNLDNIVLDNIHLPGPIVTDGNISISGGTGTGGAYKIGDTVTATWNNTAGGDNNAGITGVTMDFSAFGGGTNVAATNSGGTWTATYTIVAGAIDGTGKNVSITVTDNAGNTKTTADTTNATVDNVAPTVTDGNISISGASGTGGAFRIGDTVTVTWNNTAAGDNNGDISGVIVDFSQFGGGTNVAATNSGGTWTATYTIVAGGIDGTNRNISITATDNAGNTKTTADTTNATVDNIAPTVTDGNISISGASGTGGAYRIGDTVTATWNNTAAGDNNGDISGVTVDFSQFGGGTNVAATNSGGTWTATYTIIAGAMNGATNRNISITTTDNAGNTRTTADTSNAMVDNVAPAITFSGVAFSADTGSSSSDFITATAAQTITATLSGAPGGTDIVYGSLDNGATWTNITSKVSGTTLTWNGVSLTGSSTLRLKVTDAAGNDGAVFSKAYTLDAAAPGAPSAPDMTAATDSGSLDTDNLTNDTTPTFTGTAESGSTVTLYDTDGTTVLGSTTATGGTWTITSSTLSAGSHTLTAKATDAAGNVSSASGGLSVVIETSAPTGVAASATTIPSSTTTSGATIATLSATDAQTVTYGMAIGNGSNDADNGKFAIVGNSLKVGGVTLTAGTYHLYVKATDAAGNIAYQALTLNVVDAPSVSSILRAGGASATVATAATSIAYTVTFDQSVTGVDAGDFILTATGSAAGSIASVTGSGTTYTVTVNSLGGDGTLRLDLKGSGTGIKNGSSVDILGGYATGATYTLDHTAPAAPAAPDMTAGTDSGILATDNLTSNTTPTFTGTAESGSTVTLYDTDGTTVLGSTTATGGTWSITSSVLSAGAHTLTAKATDAAGNVSSASASLAVTIDTTAPGVASVSVPANGSYKEGQTLSFTVNAGEAITVNGGGMPSLALDIGGVTRYAAYASGSGSSALVFTYTIQAGETDSDGITVLALQSNGSILTDAAGNGLTLTLNGVASTAGVLVDTTAPTVNSVTVPANGTYYNGQNLDFTVNFSEAVTVDTAGGTPRIAIWLDTGGTVYADYVSGSGTSSLVFRHSVGNGERDTTGIAVAALVTNGGTLRDAAGNDATLSLNSIGSTTAVKVDASQPSILNVTSSTADGDYKAGATITLTVTFSTAVNVDTTGGTPTLALGGGGTATYQGGSGSTTLTFAYTVGAGDNSADLDYASAAALSLNGATIKDTNGSHQDALLSLFVPGAAGSLGANKAIVVDTTAPVITFSNLALSADTGSSGSDFITATAGQTLTATLSGAPAGTDVVYGSLDNGATWTDITGKVAGTTLTWNGVTLAGSGTLKLKVTDAAGNDGTVYSQAYTLDTAAPNAPAAPDLAAASDSGISSSDNLTRITTPTLTGTAEAGSTVVLYDTDGTTVLGTTAADGSGRWSITSSALSEGNHTLTAKATDAAGNTSAASAGLAVTIDTSAPSAQGVPVLAAASDSGISSSDRLTRVATPTVTGTAEAGSTVVLYDTDGTTMLGTATADGSGRWSITASALSAGIHTLTAKATDGAGNTSAASAGLVVTIDTAAPGAPSAPDLIAASDSGASSSDDLTRITTPTVTGTAEAGSTVTLYDTDGTTVLGSAAADGSGRWSITASALSAGVHTLTARATDGAGNVSAASAGLAVTVDTAAPAITVAPLVTGSTTPTLTGTANEGTLAVTVGGATYTVIPVNGAWQLDLTTAVPASGRLALVPGNSYTVSVAAIDAAGNASTASGKLDVVVIARVLDSQPGVPPAPPLAQPMGIPPAPAQLPAPAPFLAPQTERILGGMPLSFGGERGVSPSEVRYSPGAGDAGLQLGRPMADQTLPAGQGAEIRIPADTFIGFGADGALQLSAMQANGRPLPNWIRFDAAKGTFVANPPPGVSGELTVRLSARDTDGRMVVTTFKIRVGGNRQAGQESPGRIGLSEQIRLAARPAGRLGHLAAHAAAVSRNSV